MGRNHRQKPRHGSRVDRPDSLSEGTLKIWLRPFQTLKPGDDTYLAEWKKHLPTACVFLPRFSLAGTNSKPLCIEANFQKKYLKPYAVKISYLDIIKLKSIDAGWTCVIGTLADIHALWQSEFTKLIMHQDVYPSDL